MLRLGCAFLLLAALLRPASLSAAPDEARIAALYARGLAGDKEAVVACVAALQEVLAARPDDQRARVYLGSAETLRSRDLPFGMAKWTTLRRGIAEMDEAAAASPNDAKVQLLRAVTNEAFPAVLGRRQLARQALDELVAAVEKDPRKLTPSEQQLLYLNAGDAALKAGDQARARILWQKGMALAAAPSISAEIRAALAKLPE